MEDGGGDLGTSEEPGSSETPQEDPAPEDEPSQSDNSQTPVDISDMSEEELIEMIREAADELENRDSQQSQQ